MVKQKNSFCFLRYPFDKISNAEPVNVYVMDNSLKKKKKLLSTVKENEFVFTLKRKNHIR